MLAIPIRTESHAIDFVGVPVQRQSLLAARGVPEPHRVVMASRCETRFHPG